MFREWDNDLLANSCKNISMLVINMIFQGEFNANVFMI